ncbi:DNA repair protein RecO [Candidatus Uhrbacteria bacterium]|nr:DNA repair protein RecO [Candidatus Uhrbacteria bacterium]
MGYIRDQVVVLKKMSIREWDRQYFLYGKEHGLLLAVARGAMKISAKQASQLEPFSFADVMIAKGRAYDHLAVAVRGKQSKRFFSVSAYAVAGAFSDLCLKLLKPGVADERIFKLWVELSGISSQIKAEISPLRAQLLFSAVSLRLLDLLGYGPFFKSCAMCGEAQGPTEVFYAPERNAVVCLDCRGEVSEALIRVPAHAMNLLQFLRSASLADVLRITAKVDLIETVVVMTREICKHAPLDREPHGFQSISKLVADS